MIKVNFVLQSDDGKKEIYINLEINNIPRVDDCIIFGGIKKQDINQDGFKTIRDCQLWFEGEVFIVVEVCYYYGNKYKVDTCIFLTKQEE